MSGRFNLTPAEGVNLMASKKQTKGKRISQPKPAKEAPLTFSYEFLDMLVDTASIALGDHLKKIGAVNEAHLLDMIMCLVIEQHGILIGRKQDVEDTADKVTRTVGYTSLFGTEWCSVTGTITPLKEQLARVKKDHKEA
jgi:hypothetical protein